MVFSSVGLRAGADEDDVFGPGLGYGKQMLSYMVTDLRVEVGQLTLRGTVSRLEKAVTEMNVGTVTPVPHH